MPKTPPQPSPLPLTPPRAATRQPAPAPAWVALTAAWIGLLTLAAAVVVPWLPRSRDPVGELERRAPFSVADRFLPVPVYGAAAALFLGIVVLWQMRRERRPLPAPLVAQRVQAWVGIALSLLATAIIYVFVALRGPGA